MSTTRTSGATAGNRLSIWRRLQCPWCLATFQASRRLACCERGCSSRDVMTPGAGSRALVFDPRSDPSQSLWTRWRNALSVPHQAICPGCRRETTRWVCPDCRANLPELGLGDLVAALVLVGPRQSGKTTFAAMVLRELAEHFGPSNGLMLDPWSVPSAEPSHHTSEAALAKPHAIAAVNDGGNSHLAATPALATPSIYRLRRTEGSGHRSCWLSVFDIPGAFWEDRDASLGAAERILSRARGLLLLLDPTRLNAIEARLRKRGSTSPALQSRDPTTGFDPNVWRRISPADELRHLAAILERNGQHPEGNTAVALVLTKFDVWGELAPEGTLLHRLATGFPPTGLAETDLEQSMHEELEALLVEWAGQTVVQQIDMKLPNLRCFAISSLGPAISDSDRVAPRPFGVERPLRWILGRSNAPL